MHEQSTPATLTGEAAARLAEFARACKTAARAVSLYPAGHPAIGGPLERLARLTATLTDQGPYRLQVTAGQLMPDGAALPRPDAAVAELASLLHRHFIGRITLGAGADAQAWRALLLLLARPPEEVRADGGIRHLWSTAGGPSIELEEIDYAEVLRKKQGVAATVEQIVAAALEGASLQLDESGVRLLMDIVRDPTRLEDLLAQVEAAVAQHGADVEAAAFLALVRGITERLAQTDPARLDAVLDQMGRAAGRLSAEAMLALVDQRRRDQASGEPAAAAGAVLARMPDGSLSHFVASSVIKERGATERLAQAFQALVPDIERQRRLIALAAQEVGASEAAADGFTELWQRVETMLLSYSDETFVSEQYARELTSARTRAVDVEQTSDDPPDRIAGWLATVVDAALRDLDHELLVDLLRIEADVLRWRDIADTAAGHVEDLVRVGYFDQAWRLAHAIANEGARAPERGPYAAAALERLGRGAILTRHVSAHLREADDASYGRFKALCQAIGPPVIQPLAEALAGERDARSRQRLRDVLLEFGARGRESVRQLTNAANWEVRRTAVYLLREFGGPEALKELIPLLTDTEPLVQHEAVQGLVMNGSEEAARILLQSVGAASGRARDTLLAELSSATRDQRAAPLFCYLVRHMDRRLDPRLFLASVDALGTLGGARAVDALKHTLYRGEWRAPLVTRRIRMAAARALKRIGTPAAIEVLQAAASGGPRGARAAAQAELGGRN